MMNSMLEYRGYHASVEYDAEDIPVSEMICRNIHVITKDTANHLANKYALEYNIFVGEVFGITDSLNFHGTSVSELKEMFEQSIDNYLELCEKIGKNPDKKFKGTFNVRIPPEMHKKAALAAAKRKMTLNQYVIKAIDQSFEEIDSIKETV